MCGICGFFSKSPSSSSDSIFKMNSAISHRGPDDSGTWHDQNMGIVFGHQRLAVIDLSVSGHQPMKSSSGRYMLIYNGEIYNHLDIRKKIEKKFALKKWQGSSDTETLLEAIEVFGFEQTLKEIVGMFAFVIWDKKLRNLILARDRMGEKPLYFGWQGQGDNAVFLFGSELKALKAHPGFKGEVNRDALALLLRHNCIPAPYSIYKDIKKLLPGHFLKLNEADLRSALLPNSKQFWSLTDIAQSGVKNPILKNSQSTISELDKLLRQSIKQQMVSDVPLGAFLSGGVDSSTVVALMQAQSSQPIKTFTVGFNEDGYNEAEQAKAVAKHLGTDHTEIYISAKEAMSVIPKLPSLYDEPFSDSSQIPTFLVSQLAKKNVSVSLSGDAGDELFCGYNRHQISNNIWKKISLLPAPLRKLIGTSLTSLSPQKWNKLSKWIPGSDSFNSFGDKIHKGANVLDASSLNDLYLKLVSHWENPSDIVLNSKEPATIITDHKFEFQATESQQKMMLLDGLTYLPDDILVKVDRAAMGVSLETRIPYLDHRVVEFAWKIPQSLKVREGKSKWILREVLNQYVPKKLFERPKMGFGIPIGTWLRGPLRDWAESLLNEKRLQDEGFFNPDPIRKKWKEHLSEKKNWQYQLWDILMFQAWLDEN